MSIVVPSIDRRVDMVRESIPNFSADAQPRHLRDKGFTQGVRTYAFDSKRATDPFQGLEHAGIGRVTFLRGGGKDKSTFAFMAAHQLEHARR